MRRRVWLPLAIVLAFAGCRDATAPLPQQQVAGPQFRRSAVASDTTQRYVASEVYPFSEHAIAW